MMSILGVDGIWIFKEKSIDLVFSTYSIQEVTNWMIYNSLMFLLIRVIELA